LWRSWALGLMGYRCLVGAVMLFELASTSENHVQRSFAVAGHFG
jgi:hypothetical protein